MTRIIKIIGVLVVAIVALLIFVNIYVCNKIEQKLDELNGLSVADSKISIVKNSAVLKNGLYEEDATVSNRASFESIQLSGLSRMKYLQEGEFELGEIIVEGLDLHVHIDKKSAVNEHDTSKHDEFVFIRDFIIRDGTVNLYKKGKQVAKINSINARLNDAEFHRLDSIYVEDYFLRTEQIAIDLPDQLYKVMMSSLQYDADDQVLSMKSLSYDTKVPIENWFEVVKKKKSRMSLSAAVAEVVKPDIKAILTENTIDMQRVTIQKPTLEVYEDARFEHCHTCVQQYPHVALSTADVEVSVDSIQIVNGDLIYLSNDKGGRNQGRLEFASMYMSGYHLSNRPKEVELQPKLLIDAQADIYGASRLNAHFEFDLLKSSGDFLCRGETSPLDLRTFNDFLRPIKLVEVASGQSSGMQFQFNYKNNQTNGHLNFPYRDLKVAMLDKERFPNNRMVSGLINKFAIRNNNLKGGKYDTGVIYYNRDRSKSIFHLMSRSLQTGIESSVVSKLFLREELKSRMKN